MEHLGKTLASLGACLFILGLLLWLLADKVSLSWLGRLPGDMRLERPGLQLYFPLTTMLLLSLALSVLLWLCNKWFR